MNLSGTHNVYEPGVLMNLNSILMFGVNHFSRYENSAPMLKV